MKKTLAFLGFVSGLLRWSKIKGFNHLINYELKTNPPGLETYKRIEKIND